MISQDNDTHNSERSTSGVWSDLRAMKLLEQNRQNLDALTHRTNRNRLMIVLSTCILSTSSIALAVLLFLTYGQLQQLQQQVQPTSAHIGSVPDFSLE